MNQSYDPFIEMLKSNLAESKEDVRTLKSRVDELTRENHELRIEKGTFEKTRQLDEQVQKAGLQGAMGETIKDVLMEAVDLGKTFLASKIPNNGGSQMFGDLDDDQKTLIESVVEHLKSLDNEALSIMSLINEVYAGSPESRTLWLEQYKQQVQAQNAPQKKTTNQLTNVNHF